MAFLEADASLAQTKAAYKANCLYRINGSVEQCKQFIQACFFLTEFAKPETRQGSAALREDPAIYERAQRAAEEWLASVDPAFAGSGGGSVTFADLSALRE